MLKDALAQTVGEPQAFPGGGSPGGGGDTVEESRKMEGPQAQKTPPPGNCSAWEAEKEEDLDFKASLSYEGAQS